MKIKPYIILIILSLVISIGITSTLKAESNPPMRIGFIVPFTGPFAEFGYAMQNGVALAASTNPKLREVFEPVFEDSQYDSKTSLANFHKLRSMDQVKAVYVFGGPMSDTLAPIAEQAKMPMFSTEYDIRYTKDKQYVIRFANNAEDYAAALLSKLRAKNLKRFGIIKVENQYHNTLFNALKNMLREDESAKVLYNFQPGENDFRVAFAKIGQGSFDALGVYLVPGMQHAFLSQFKQYDFSLPLFGTDTFESASENAGVEQVVEGALFANSFVSKSFIQRYKKAFNNTSQVVHAALAYEFALLVANLFADGNTPVDAIDFIKRFSILKSRPSVCGEYNYRNLPSTGQYFSFPMAIREVRDGVAEIIEVQKLQPYLFPK